jgi:hypothetical protein
VRSTSFSSTIILALLLPAGYSSAQVIGGPVAEPHVFLSPAAAALQAQAAAPASGEGGRTDTSDDPYRDDEMSGAKRAARARRDPAKPDNSAICRLANQMSGDNGGFGSGC